MSKILYLSPGCFDKGGISRYNRYQIRALRELKGENNVKVISLLGRSEGDFEDDFTIDWQGWGANTLSKLAFTFQFLKILRSWKPDIIWLGHVNLTELLVRFNILGKYTSVLNVYGLEVWSGLRPKVEEGFKKVDYVIADCQFTQRYVEEEGTRPKGSVEVIWDCVDLEKFRPFSIEEQQDFYKNYNLPNPSEKPWLLTLGRLSFAAAHKGYERLLEVFAKAAHLNQEIILVFAGKGDMVDFLKSEANRLGVADRVYFSGMVHEVDMPKFYSAASIFSLVSDRGVGRGEGIPLTPLEAMACGTAIIVGNQDGSQEAIFEDKNGFCIDSLDLAQHAQVIRSLLSDPDLLEKKSQAANLVAHKYFSFETFKVKHQEFLGKIK
ncbi:MAG: glycosyltransferase family 4 protein [Algoriphagus sp.]|nr:glycosyltransferase family 4 protein [Algoriphagus sp.]